MGCDEVVDGLPSWRYKTNVKFLTQGIDSDEGTKKAEFPFKLKKMLHCSIPDFKFVNYWSVETIHWKDNFLYQGKKKWSQKNSSISIIILKLFVHWSWNDNIVF